MEQVSLPDAGAALERIFNATPDDLACLAAGRFSPATRQRLAAEARLEAVLLGGGVLFVALLSLPVLLTRAPLAMLIALALGAAFLLPWVRYLRQLHADLAEGRVEQASGAFLLRGPLMRRSYFNSHGLVDQQGRRYLVKSHEFQLIRQAEGVGLARPHPGGVYTVYYLPRSRRVAAMVAAPPLR